MDMTSRKMTVVGTVDPVGVVSRLRKTWAAQLDSVGPAKEPEKKKEGDGAKKEEGDGAKKEEEGDGARKEEEGDGKEEDGDEKKKKEGEGKTDHGGEGKMEGHDDAKKEGGGGAEKKVAPLHHLPAPQYMNMVTADYMNQNRPQPPAVYPPPYAPQPYYYVRNMSMEDNPNSCAIC
jgi:hypothetical protein